MEAVRVSRTTVWLVLLGALVAMASGACHSERPDSTAPPLRLTNDEIAAADNIALTDARVKQLTTGHSPFVDDTSLLSNDRTKIGADVRLSLRPPVDLPAGLPTLPATKKEEPLRVQSNGRYVTIPLPCTIFGASGLDIYVDFRVHGVVAIAPYSASPGGKC